MRLRASLLCALAVSAIVLGSTMLANGRVFMRWGTHADQTKTLLALGGELLYEAPVAINGGHGSVSVFGFHASIDEVMRSLETAFGSKNCLFSGGTMGCVVASSSGNLVRLSVNEVDGGNCTVVFQLEQSRRDAARAETAPSSHDLRAIPQFPDSTPTFHTSDKRTGTDVMTARTHASEESVRRFYNSRLTEDGWTAMTVPSSGVGVYTKGAAVCCVFVSAEDTHGSQITLLHKRLEIE